MAQFEFFKFYLKIFEIFQNTYQTPLINDRAEESDQSVQNPNLDQNGPTVRLNPSHKVYQVKSDSIYQTSLLLQFELTFLMPQVLPCLIFLPKYVTFCFIFVRSILFLYYQTKPPCCVVDFSQPDRIFAKCVIKTAPPKWRAKLFGIRPSKNVSEWP